MSNLSLLLIASPDILDKVKTPLTLAALIVIILYLLYKECRLKGFASLGNEPLTDADSKSLCFGTGCNSVRVYGVHFDSYVSFGLDGNDYPSRSSV